MEAQSEYAHIAYAFSHVLAPIRMLRRCLLTKFLHRSSLGSLSRVHCWLGKMQPLLGWSLLCFVKLSFTACTYFVFVRSGKGKNEILLSSLLYKEEKAPKKVFAQKVVSNALLTRFVAKYVRSGRGHSVSHRKHI